MSSSEPEETPGGAAASRSQAQFRSAHAQAMLCILLLMLWCLLALLAIGSQVAHLGLETDSEGHVRYLVVLIAQIVVLVATTAAFAFWVFRAYENLTVL